MFIGLEFTGHFNTLREHGPASLCLPQQFLRKQACLLCLKPDMPFVCFVSIVLKWYRNECQHCLAFTLTQLQAHGVH